MPAQKWTKENLKILQEMLNENKPTSYIAKVFGVSKDTIRVVIMRYKLQRPAKRSSSFHSSSLQEKFKLTKKDIATRLRMLQNLEEAPEMPIKEISDDRLKIYIQDYSAFVRDLCNVELQDYQLEMFDIMRNSKRVVFCMGRQIGKTFTVALFVLAQCVINPNQKILIIAPTLRQSRIMFDTITRFLVQNDELFYSVKKSNAGLEFSIKFKNNSEIHALPSGERGENIRGFSGVTHIIVEECAHGISDEVFQAIEPMLAITNGSLILVSTPAGCFGKFWDAFNSPLYTKLHLPSYKNKYLSKEWLETQKQEMSSIAYETEIEARFSEQINNFFSTSTIQRCTQNYDFYNFPRAQHVYYCGIDTGRYKDSSVIMVLEQAPDGTKKIVNIKEFKNMPLTQQREHIIKLHERFQFKKICIERAGLSEQLVEELKSERLPILEFVPTIDNKMTAYNYLLSQMEQSKIIIPNNQTLQFQLRMFRYEITNQGKLKLHHATEMAGDDYCDALCLAVLASKEPIPYHYDVVVV